MQAIGMDKLQARRWVVRGRVQGVGFRFFVQEKAASLGVRGWARNTDDGAVEVFGAGTADRLDDLAAALHAGPRLSEVRSVEQEEAGYEKFSSFAIR